MTYREKRIPPLGQLMAIARSADELLAILKPSGLPHTILDEWPELKSAVTGLEVAMGVDGVYLSASATQPIATRAIIDGDGNHIGFWRVCQVCRNNLAVVGEGEFNVNGTVLCSQACMDEWAYNHPRSVGQRKSSKQKDQ